MSRIATLLLSLVVGVSCLTVRAVEVAPDAGVFVSPDGPAAAEPRPVQATARPEAEPVAEPARKLPQPERKSTGAVKPAASDEKTGAAAAPGEEKTIVVNAAELAVPLPENEQKLLDIIKAAIAEKGRLGLKGRKTQTLIAGQAALKGLERNLGIQRQEKQEAIVAAARQEARAVFDPVFVLSFTHSMYWQNDRMERVNTFSRPSTGDFRGNDPRVSQGDVVDLGTTASPSIPIKELDFTAPRDGGYRNRWEVASKRDVNGARLTENPSIAVAQQLPWGPVMSVTISSKKSPSFFEDGPNASIELKREQLKSLQSQMALPILQDGSLTEAERTTKINALVDPATNKLLTDEISKYDSAYKLSIDRLANTGRPWTTTMNGGFTMPLPYMRNFGRYAGPDVGLRVADLNKERAYWDTATVVNGTLGSIDVAYWNLVGAIENIRAVLESRKLVESVYGNTKKMLDAQRTTQYAMLQVETQLASVKQQEEAAWSFLIQASNVLTNFLDDDKESIFLPAGYSKALGEEVKWDATDAIKVAMDNRPDLKAQRIQGQVSDVLLKYAEHQARPDLSYGFNYNVSQVSQPFGYGSWEQSMGAMFGAGKNDEHQIYIPNKGVGTPANLNDVRMVNRRDVQNGPDNQTVTNSFAYNWPWRNRALKAAHKIAEGSRDQQDYLIGMTENQVEEDIGDAVAGVLSAREQLALAKEGHRLALSAFEDARKMIEAGRMTEFEMVSRLQDLLANDQAEISAGVNYKIAQTVLLQAEGILPNVYPGLHAVTSIDKDRIKAMGAHNALHFFKPMDLAVVPLNSDAAPAETTTTAGK